MTKKKRSEGRKLSGGKVQIRDKKEVQTKALTVKL